MRFISSTYLYPGQTAMGPIGPPSRPEPPWGSLVRVRRWAQVLILVKGSPFKGPLFYYFFPSKGPLFSPFFQKQSKRVHLKPILTYKSDISNKTVKISKENHPRLCGRETVSYVFSYSSRLIFILFILVFHMF